MVTLAASTLKLANVMTEVLIDLEEDHCKSSTELAAPSAGPWASWAPRETRFDPSWPVKTVAAHLWISAHTWRPVDSRTVMA